MPFEPFFGLVPIPDEVGYDCAFLLDPPPGD